MEQRAAKTRSIVPVGSWSGKGRFTSSAPAPPPEAAPAESTQSARAITRRIDDKSRDRLRSDEWLVITDRSNLPAFTFHPTAYNDTLLGKRARPDSIVIEPPMPLGMDPEALKAAPWCIYQSAKSFDAKQMRQLAAPDVTRLRNEYKMDDGAFRNLYTRFAKTDTVMFALRHPDTMRALFGGDCADGTHPNFAHYSQHPYRTLLKPTSGAMYYIQLQGHSEGQEDLSPSVFHAQSAFAWKSKGAAEALQVGYGDGECLVYKQYECRLKPEEHGDIPVFQLRVYTLHASDCECTACQKRKRGTKENHDIPARSEKFLLNLALVQILDQANSRIKNKRDHTDVERPKSVSPRTNQWEQLDKLADIAATEAHNLGGRRMHGDPHLPSAPSAPSAPRGIKPAAPPRGIKPGAPRAGIKPGGS